MARLVTDILFYENCKKIMKNGNIHNIDDIHLRNYRVLFPSGELIVSEVVYC